MTLYFDEDVPKVEIEVVQRLLNEGMDPNVRGSLNEPLVFTAARACRDDIIVLLASSGADLNIRSGVLELTALMAAACEKNGAKSVQTLLRLGADVDAKDSNGRTVLMLAVGCQRPDVVKIIIEAGADVNVKDIHGTTVLLQAKQSRKELGILFDRISSLLKKNGAR